MVTKAPRLEVVAIALGVLLAFLLLLLRAASDGLLELGDGVNHYMIARYAWKHPLLFLDLWGKPLFTVLASPFAQFGHLGVAGFNVLVAAATCWMGIRALRSAGGVAQLAFPVLLLLAPQYVLMVLAGMTEPLFGLVTVITVLLLVHERHAPAAAVASLAPFARPEYIAFLPLVMVWLAYERKWRALPWCLLGFVVYGALAGFVHGDVLWFWTGDPYGYAYNAYGSGPLDFFVSRAGSVYGWPLVLLGVSALILWPLIHQRDAEQRRAHRLFLMTAALPALGIVAVHSILWWKGWRGSAGLVRVLVTSIPLFGLFTVFTLGRGAQLLLPSMKLRGVIAVFALPGVFAWAVADLLGHVQLPIRPEMNQRFLDSAAFGVKRHQLGKERVYSTHPYIAFRAELDPFDSARYNPIWGLSDVDVGRRFKEGDLLVWDSQLGSNESGIPLDRLLNDGRFAVVETYEPPEGSRVLGGHIYEIFLFERRDVVREFTTDTVIWNGRVRSVPRMRVDTVPCTATEPARWCLKEGEFPVEIRQLPLPTETAIYDEWIVSGQATVEDGSRLAIVFSQQVNGHGVRYDQEELVSGAFVFNRRVPPVAPGTEQVIYFWNMGKQPFSLEGFSVVRKRWTQRPA
jgi:hypothetical protein